MTITSATKRRLSVYNNKEHVGETYVERVEVILADELQAVFLREPTSHRHMTQRALYVKTVKTLREMRINDATYRSNVGQWTMYSSQSSMAS